MPHLYKPEKPYTAAELEALGDWVLTRPLAPREERNGVIVVTLQKDPRPVLATVVAVGPGKLTDDGVRVPIALAPGDRVLVQEYGVVVHEQPGRETLRCYPAEKVLAKFDPDAVVETPLKRD